MSELGSDEAELGESWATDLKRDKVGRILEVVFAES